MNNKTINIINNGIVSIIPARSGSKGVKNKNIRCLCGYPLIAYAIAASKLSQCISRVIVSTDSGQYAEIARRYGAEAPFLRPDSISGDKSPDIDFMNHVIHWLQDNEGMVPEYFVHMRPTFPLRNPDFIDEAINVFINNSEATSLRSAHLASNTPYKWFTKTEDGRYYKSILNSISLDEANNPRQDFPNVYIPDGYVDVLKTKFIVESGLMHGDRMIAFESPSGVDIDEVKDLEYLNYKMRDQEHMLLKYLKNNFEPLD